MSHILHLLLIALLLLAACVPGAVEPGPLTEEAAYPAPTNLQGDTATPGAYPPPSPISPPFTPEPEPTEPPTPTNPPAPTLMPTPLVTPIPTVAPPIIPDVVGKEQQPFWIYYWQDNEVWRVDDQGQDRELLLDTYKSLGQWLTEFPDLYKGTDCCWVGPRVVLSPDGQKLALVVVNKIHLADKGDPFTLSIYIFDVETRELKPIGEGNFPVWSPDGERLAFIRNGGMWIVDLESGQMNERVAKHEEMFITWMVWSPDSKKIIYAYNYGTQRLPPIWLIDMDDNESPGQIVNPTQDWEMYGIYGIEWSPDGQQIFYLSQEGSKDPSPYHRAENLWTLSVSTGERTQLTQDIQIQNYGFLPNGRWVFLSGYQLYERSQENYDRDLWLLSLDGKDLRRITANQGDNAIIGLSPDGVRLMVWRAGDDPYLFSLETGEIVALSFDLGLDFRTGGVK